jgi:hypothetical protein
MRVITGGGVEEDTYRYDGFAGSHTWLDTLNGGITRMSVIAGNASVIMFGGVNLPSTGAAQVGNFRMTLQDGTPTGEMGFASSVPRANLEIKNFVHGAQIRLTGEDGSGVEQILFLADPDATSQMYFAGSRTIVTQATGTSILGLLSNDPTAGGNQDSTIQFQNLTPVAVGDIGFVDGDANIVWYNRVHGAKTIIRGESDAGTVRDVIEIDYSSAGGFIKFREPNGTRELMELVTGINAVTQKANSTNQPSGGFAQVGMFRVQNRNASPELAMFVGFDESIPTTTLRLKNFVHGGPLELVGENAAGTERILFFYDPDNSGPIIFGPTDNPPTTDASVQDTRLTFRNPSAQTIWQIGFLEGNNDFSIKLFQDTGLLRLRGSSAASADTLLATFDPVADVKLFQAGAEVFRTVGAAAGGAQANNTLTGAGFERVLTTADISGSPFTEIILTNSNVIDLVDTDVALNIGAAVPGSNPHLEIGFTNGATDLGMQAKADATSVLELELNRQGGNVRVGSQNTGVAGATFLYASNGASAGAVIETVISGMILEGKAGGSTVLDWHVVNGTLAMRAVFNGAHFQFEGFVNSEEIRFQSRNSAAAVRQMLHLDPDADVEIYHPLTDRIALRTTDLGADILGENTTTSELGFFSTDGLTERARIRTDPSSAQFSSRVNGNGISLRVLSGAGAEQVGVSVSGSTGVTDIRWTGLIRAFTASSGLTIRGNAATNVIALWQGSTAVSIFAMRGEGTQTIWDSLVDSSHLIIRGNNSVSATAECARFDPDAEVRLDFAGVSVMRTLAAASGGLEANNTLTGAGFERVLTIADRRSAEIYAPTNVSTDRAYDANATTLDELADVLGTLIADLQAIDVIQ